MDIHSTGVKSLELLSERKLNVLGLWISKYHEGINNIFGDPNRFLEMKKLDISCYPNIQTKFFIEMKNLKSLYVSNLKFKLCNESFPVLKDLEIIHCEFREKEINDEIMSLSNLEYLKFRYCVFIQKQYNFSSLKQLKKLVIVDCSGIIEFVGVKEDCFVLAKNNTTITEHVGINKW